MAELSKVANEVSVATIKFFNSIEGITPDTSLESSSLANDSKKKAPKRKRKDPKIKVDPNAPKKPLTMFLAFSVEMRRNFHREDREHKENDENYTALTNAEVTQKISKLWASLDEEGKKPWKDKYEKEMADYKVAKESYLQDLKFKNDEVKLVGDTPTPSSPIEEILSDELNNALAEETPKKKVKKEKKKK